MNKKFTLYAVATLLSIISFQAVAELTLGIFPRRPVAVSNKIFKPFAKELSAKIGEPVKVAFAKDFKTFWKGVKEDKYDIVHYNQYHYLLAHKEKGHQVFAVNKEQGKADIAGALTVRADSGINTIADLKGKTILFGGGKKAMGSYIAPTWALKKAGLVAGKDYTVKFSKNPPSAVIGVFNKAADASGSGDVILKVKGVQKKIDVSQMKILASSDRFIHLTWAASKSVPADKVKKIQDAMVAMSGTPVAKTARVNGWAAASDGDFGKVREIVKEVTGEDL